MIAWHAVERVSNAATRLTSLDILDQTANFRAYNTVAHGNMTTRLDAGETYTHTWDAQNRLGSVAAPAKNTAWVSDLDGARVSNNDSAITTVYVGGSVEVQISGTMRLATSYYFFGGARIAMRVGDTVTYLHGDRLGSASLATDIAGNVLSQERYYVWGSASMMSGTMPTDFQWQNQRRLDESQTGKLYDFNARFFTPVAARFISPDSMVPNPADPQSLNRYTAMANNPLKFTDPTGHYEACDDGMCKNMHDSRNGLPISYVGGLTGRRRWIAPTYFMRKSPVSLSRRTFTQAYGPTRYAKDNWDGLYSQTSGMHGGIDLGAPEGTPVNAGVAFGTVVDPREACKYGRACLSGDAGTPGNVVVRVGDYYVVYGHTVKDASLKFGDEVGPDTVVGTVGAHPNGSHLHLSVLAVPGTAADTSGSRKQWVNYNPLLFFDVNDALSALNWDEDYEGTDYHAHSVYSFEYGGLIVWSSPGGVNVAGTIFWAK